MLKSSTTPYLARCAAHGERSSIGTAFQYNTEITSFDELKFFTSIVSTTSLNIPYFRGCSNLVLLTLPNSITTICNYFAYQTKLIDITIPSSATQIGSRSFGAISTLKTVTVLKTTPPSIDSLTFQNSNNLTNIYVPAASVDAYKAATNWSAYASKISAIPE